MNALPVQQSDAVRGRPGVFDMGICRRGTPRQPLAAPGGKRAKTGFARMVYEVTYTNAYVAPAPAPVVVEGFEVTKNLTGTPLTAGAFEYQLAGEGAPMPAQAMATNDADGRVVFDSITYDEPGAYNYIISEINGGKQGYTYSDNVVGVTVTVTDNGRGQLVAEVAYSGNTTFENAYEASGSVDLSVAKELIGRTLEEGQFTFELLDEEGNVIQTTTNNASGAVQFDAITYSEKDFDKKDDEETSAEEAATEIAATGEAATEESSAEGDEAADEASEGGEEAADGADSEPADDNTGDGGISESESAVSDEGMADEVSTEAADEAAGEGDGYVETESEDASIATAIAVHFKMNEFAKLFAPEKAWAEEAARTKVFTYTIREVAGDEAGYSYDSHEVTVTVTVVNNGDGSITATPEYQGNTTFTNKYEAPAIPPDDPEPAVDDDPEPTVDDEPQYDDADEADEDDEADEPDAPDEPDVPGKHAPHHAPASPLPKTGDAAPVVALVIAALVSAAVLAGIARKRSAKRKE